MASTFLYPCCVETLKVGNTSGVHCCSTNRPNVTEDSGLLLAAFTVANISSSLACASRRVGNSAMVPRSLETNGLPTLRRLPIFNNHPR